MPDDRAAAVLAFWFGAGNAPRREWFRKDGAFDAAIAAQFAGLVEDALGGGLTEWRDGADSALARILLLDQFTRNIFRGTPRAFEGDAQALDDATALVAAGQDRMFAGQRRQFVYLPFEHAEDLGHQRTALQLFGQLARDEPALAGQIEWAQRHHDIIARFGRFPHRNAILGRQSTAEELEFLQQPGSSF